MSLRFKTIVFLGVLLLIFSLLYLAPNRLTNSLQVYSWKKISERLDVYDAPTYGSIFFFDENNGVALTIASMESTKDGGKTWKTSSDFNNKAISSLVFTNPDIWVVGEELTSENEKRNKPIILKTNDKGIHWENQVFDASSLKQVNEKFSNFKSMCFDKNGKSWLVGDGGIIEAKFHENRVSVLNIFETKEKLYRVFCEDSGRIWAVGGNGVITYYDKNQWNYQKLGDDKSFTKIMVNSDYIWLTGSSISISNESRKVVVKGILLRSKDKGLTWEDKTPALADGLVDIYFENNTGWVVGLKGGIYSTVDGGDSWIKQISPTQNNLVSIFFCNSENGWISGDKGTILKF